MNRSYRDFYEEMSLEQKEEMRKKILSGAGGKTAAPRRARRITILAANIAAAACLAVVAIVLWGTGRGQNPVSLLPATSDPGTLPTAAAEDWIYYAAKHNGLFRVLPDGSRLEKVENAFPAEAKVAAAKDVTVHGEWLYYSFQYATGDTFPEYSDLRRMKADGTGQPEPILEKHRSIWLSYQIRENEIFWSDETGVYKMQLDGTGQVPLQMEYADSSLSYRREFTVSNDLVYYWATEEEEAAIAATLTTGAEPEEPIVLFIRGTEIMFSELVNPAGDADWIYCTSTAEKSPREPEYQIEKINVNTGETQVLLTESIHGGFYEEWIMADGWVYYPDCPEDMKDLGPLCKSNGGDKIVLSDREYCSNVQLPDGRLYYTVWEEQSGREGLYRINTDGSDEQFLGWLDGTQVPTPTLIPMPSMGPDTAQDGEWFYYPAGKSGLFRAQPEAKPEDGVTNFGKAEISGLPAALASWRDVKDVQTVGEAWVYFSLWSYDPGIPSEVVSDYATLLRIKTDGTGCEELLENRNLTSYRISGDWIYWIDLKGVHKMRLDGTEKTDLNKDEDYLWWIWCDNFVVANGRVYYMYYEDGENLKDLCIYSVGTDGGTPEVFYRTPQEERSGLDTVISDVYHFAEDAGGLYYKRELYGAGGTGQPSIEKTEIVRVSLSDGKAKTFFSSDIKIEEWLLWDGWLLYTTKTFINEEFGTRSMLFMVQPDGSRHGQMSSIPSELDATNLHIIGGKPWHTAYNASDGKHYVVRLDGIYDDGFVYGKLGAIG